MIDLDRGTDSLFFCWTTEQIHEIYTSTIKNITGDTLSGIPLKYISNETSRLTVKYSLLIKQYALSDTAYEYWNQLKKLSQETGGLYETQPPQIRGNIFNTRDDNEIVLGYFNVSGYSEKRIFVSEKFNFFPENFYCVPFVPQWVPLLSLPVYFVEEEWVRKTASRECFDCTLSGGKTDKPDFWE